MARPADQSSYSSRRSVIATGSTLLAGFALDIALPGLGFAAAEPAGASAAAAGRPSQPGELAGYRPVEVSSTDYAATPAEFAVDKVTAPGVRGTGWRAAAGDPQWISVDLQAVCPVTSVHLTFEAKAGDPVFVKAASGNPWDGTTGQENLSSYAVAFTVEVSTDKKSWTSVYQTTSGTGGAVVIDLPAPVSARWVRMTSTKRSDANPVLLPQTYVAVAPEGVSAEAIGEGDTDRQREDAEEGEAADPDERAAGLSDGRVVLLVGHDVLLDARRHAGETRVGNVVRLNRIGSMQPVDRILSGRDGHSPAPFQSAPCVPFT